ncbi:MULTISPECIES: MoxR family ATPase [unclassified Janthinobacterium]|uniref:AAA family ATPase n=1 Tax=unclassified Janthinobacterium TaxID=2610881 RepID=UPI000882E299|nr:MULTISPECIES: AAA family ATPase [unclassified Janthinobacterium]SDA64821.1 MoxR-like ATPase [Janthinobacterium sp. 551a]SFB14092.1 MoxR-like ATPase [Janthinobacterium sp. 344]
MFSKIHQAARQIGEVLVGKDLQIRQALACLLAGGHLLIEDVPGVGKTTLAHALALSLGLQWKRQQFTSDLLPADVAGMSVYDRGSASFIFHPGPLFTQVLLADEINRATPKTQSGLLEAMEERQVTLDGVTHALPQPFFVIATQNCAHQLGTFPLPESQLDRFLMCVTLGYPDPAAERALLLGADRRAMLQALPAVMSGEELLQAQAGLRAIHVSPAVVDYVLALVHATRAPGAFADGLSPRAALALLQAARAWAALQGRDHVTPDDVQAVLLPVCTHRLHAAHGVPGASDSRSLLRQLLLTIPV